MSHTHQHQPPSSGLANGAPRDEFSDSTDEWDAPIQSLSDDGAIVVTRPSARFEHMDDTERELAGEKVPITLHLPNGTTVQRVYYMGQTVELLRVDLHSLEGLPFAQTRLYLGEKLLLDPLSLNDLPFIANKNNDVRVVLKA